MRNEAALFSSLSDPFHHLDFYFFCGLAVGIYVKIIFQAQL